MIRTDMGKHGVGDRARRWPYLATALGIIALATAAVVTASRTNPASLRSEREQLSPGRPLPPLRVNGWINSRPLGRADLQGKVMVYDFWTYSCVNCVRTVPYLRSWHHRYERDGLVIVGIHSPEFEFEKVHANVEAAVRRLGVDWPVALDDDLATWRAFENRYWPAKYVADRDGRLRYTHFGEGAYRETEELLRRLLGVDPASPWAGGRAEDRPRPRVAGITPETYLGTDRGRAGARPGLATYPEPPHLEPGQVRLVGAWVADGEKVESAGTGSAVVLAYRAREVNLVMARARPEDAPLEVTVELDGSALDPASRTVHTVVEDGTTLVRVAAADMYRLVLAPEVGVHTLRLTAHRPGLQVFAFTFGA